MSSRGQHPRPLRFGTFEVDLSSSELRKAGALVKLQAQHFQLLVLLAERAGQVVTREEIRQNLWGNQTFVDFDRSINFSINQIRDALGDDPRTPRYVETLPRKGYRFIAPVTETPAELLMAEAAPKPAVVSQRGPRMRKLLLLTIAAVALAAIALAVKMGASRQTRAQPIESLAVLPLDNLSRDPEQEFFVDGMTDELITDLAKISALRVVSRTSVMQYKGTKKPVSQIARELNVGAVLEGTVLRAQDRVRITAQLIRASPERHLWAESYEGSLAEVLTLQDTVAKAVAHEIQIKLTPREQTLLATPRAVDPEAHEAYWKGRYLWEQSGETNLTKSREYFEKAIDKEPGFALAWAGLANAYERLADWGVMPRQDAAPRARAAADKALELDDSLVEPMVAIANVKMQYEWDWAGAERLFRQAIGLSPNYGYAHHDYAAYLAVTGRAREGVREEQRAHEIEPLSGIYDVGVIWHYYLAHQYDQAEAEYLKERALNADFYRGYILGSVYLKMGRQQEAVADFRKEAAASYHGILELMYLGHALGVTGDRAEGQKVLDEMLGLTKRRYVPPEFIALVYEGLGERDKALHWFEKAFAERSMHVWILSDPRLDQIRTEPRFKQLMRRMGLPQMNPAP